MWDRSDIRYASQDRIRYSESGTASGSLLAGELSAEHLAMEFRWLGAGGIEITGEAGRLLVDPFFTRPSKLQVTFGRLTPDEHCISKHLKNAQNILVTHAHYDHLMDVPLIQALTGARVYCGGNALRLLRALAVPASASRAVGVSDEIDLTSFRVRVLPGDHVRMLGRIPAYGKLGKKVSAPRRWRDYRADRFDNFLITAGEGRLLLWNGPGVEGATGAEILLVQPFYKEGYYAELIDAVRPRCVLPIHWDDFTLPLSEPPRILPALRRPGGSLLQGRGMAGFQASLSALGDRDHHVLIPERLKRYDWGVMLVGSEKQTDR